MSPRKMQTDDVMPVEARLAAVEMSRLLEYNSDDEQVPFATKTRRDSTDSSTPPSPILNCNNEPIWDAPELDSFTLLNQLEDNPTETKLARIAFTRARESISDCFAIPTYKKGELLIGQHLGKGSFSDVFEVVLSPKAVVTSEAKGRETLANSDGRKKPQRRSSMSSSVCVGSMGRTQFVTAHQGKQISLAMKCLRPQTRCNFDHFLVGIEDLVHETAILSTLDHPNIVKLWGRAGDISSFELNDGYFILLDKLQDTLQDRIDRWAKGYPNARKNAPTLSQIKVACDVSDALSYLHMSNIVFRDLKPANVGFDSTGKLKLFDFGFAAKVAPEGDSESNDPHYLNDNCGTLRYMAPEVCAALHYRKEVDVYSFRILLWEICAAQKSFSNVKSPQDFKDKVYGKEERPKLGKYWSEDLKKLMQKCWLTDPTERPTMEYVKSILTSTVCEMNLKSVKESSSLRGSLKKSFAMARRLSLNLD
eukprot:scaffold76896_cov53-Cyclotella_meneghiniana.AAC.4